MEKEYWLKMNDETPVYVKRWTDPNRESKAIIQLSHGMAEHINRYNDFANVLVENGFDVYGNDHRGHGKTGEKQGLMGFLAEQDGFSKTATDLHTITTHIKQTQPHKPVFLFGHSMGSFLARHYIQIYSYDIDGVILTGTGYTKKPLITLAKSIAAILPKKEASPFMNKLVFENFNKHIQHPKTSFDWLSRDQKEVETYINDSYCGFIPTGRFFYDLMTGLEYIQSDKQNKMIRHDLPVLIMSGDADPVGSYEQGVWKTVQLYEKAGLQSVQVSLYNDARHELLHEINKEEVYQTTLQWLYDHI